MGIGDLMSFVATMLVRVAVADMAFHFESVESGKCIAENEGVG